jgi:exosome complex RNA-binding protein Rrp42 (RNase PH superfamily)
MNTNYVTNYTKPKNILKIKKKDGKSSYTRGYNAALDKANQRAYKIINRMFEAYREALEEDEDDNYEEDD